MSRVPHSPPKKQDIAKAVSCFCFKLKRDSNPYNLLQDEVLSKEVYNRIVCVANSRANEVSRVPHSPPKRQDIAKAMSCFCFKLKRDSNPYNLLQDEVLSKEVYNRIVCGANSRANEVSRVPHSPPKKQDIAKAVSCFCIFVVCEQAVIKSGRVYRFCVSVKCIWFPLSFLKAAAVDKTKKTI